MLDYLGDDIATVVNGEDSISNIMKKAEKLGFNVFCDIPFNCFAKDIGEAFPNSKVKI